MRFAPGSAFRPRSPDRPRNLPLREPGGGGTSDRLRRIQADDRQRRLRRHAAMFPARPERSAGDRRRAAAGWRRAARRRHEGARHFAEAGRSARAAPATSGIAGRATGAAARGVAACGGDERPRLRPRSGARKRQGIRFHHHRDCGRFREQDRRLPLHTDVGRWREGARRRFRPGARDRQRRRCGAAAAATRGAPASAGAGGRRGRLQPAAPRTAAPLSAVAPPPPHSAAAPASARRLPAPASRSAAPGCASSFVPATMVCGAFTRARGGRASAAASGGEISGSFSRRLYQTIFFSFGRIS